MLIYLKAKLTEQEQSQNLSHVFYAALKCVCATGVEKISKKKIICNIMKAFVLSAINARVNYEVMKF